MKKEFVFNELPKKHRKFILFLIRNLICNTSSVQQFGLEGTEELVIKNMEDGLMYINYNPDEDSFYFALTEKGKEHFNAI